jgi:probable HAF family extracellular repeat protein
LEALGPGVAFAVNRVGFAVGETDPIGPQAIAWDQRGRRIDVVTNSMLSAAYDVGDDGTVVGMPETQDGKHFAFRWRAGHLQRLDDLPHPPGWRFESAYAIGRDGTIAGIGTLDNIPTVFRWRDRPDRSP